MNDLLLKYYWTLHIQGCNQLFYSLWKGFLCSVQVQLMGMWLVQQIPHHKPKYYTDDFDWFDGEMYFYNPVVQQYVT